MRPFAAAGKDTAWYDLEIDGYVLNNIYTPYDGVTARTELLTLKTPLVSRDALIGKSRATWLWNHAGGA